MCYIAMRMCSYQKNRKCGPICSHTSTFGKNSINSMKDTFRDETDLVIQDLLDECNDETLIKFVEASDDDLETMREEEISNVQELKYHGFCFWQ